MKQEQQRISELESYLKEAKEKQWTIDIGELMIRFILDQTTVRKCINKVRKFALLNSTENCYKIATT